MTLNCLNILQRIQEEKRTRDAEIKRREAERRVRHEKLARDGKKSFFELNQSTSQEAIADEKVTNDTHEAKKLDTKELVAKTIANDDLEKQPSKEHEPITDEPFGSNEIDLNALDYEADKYDNIDESETTVTVQRADIGNKEFEKLSKANKHNEIGGKSSKKDSNSRKDADSKKIEKRRRSRSREEKRRSRSRDKDRRHSPHGRNDRRVYRRRDHSPQRDNRRRDAHRFKRNRSRSPSREDRSRRQRHRDSK